MKLIKRTNYLNEITQLIGTPDIKVITGVRRCGKSKLMEELLNYIESSDSKANITHINFNLTDFENLLEYHAFEDFVESKYREDCNN
ncbi:MAG: ATP-binding protein, partial [Eubacterium sp.]|nr:ATP-binding protein [Eubacterium sp.]